MATIEMKDASGKKVKDAELSAAVFEIEPNVHAMHEVVRSQRAARRQGTHDTLTRGQVRGGGKKPWRQKGTGRARQGTIRAPQWAGGAVCPSDLIAPSFSGRIARPFHNAAGVQWVYANFKAKGGPDAARHSAIFVLQ